MKNMGTTEVSLRFVLLCEHPACELISMCTAQMPIKFGGTFDGSFEDLIRSGLQKRAEAIQNFSLED